MSEEKNDLLFFVNTNGPDFVLANVGYTQGDLDKMQKVLNEKEEPSNGKSKIANLSILVSKGGKPYAKFSDFKPNAPTNVAEGSQTDADDDLPF